MATTPGWYDDGHGADRWFDGAAWTEQTRPPAAVTPPEAEAQPHTEAQPYAEAQPDVWAEAGVGAGTFAEPYAQAAHPGFRSSPGAPPTPLPAWPVPTSGPSGSDPSDALHWIVPVGRSWQSIASGYLGLCGLVIWPLAPVAVWLGIWALRRARDGGHGRGRAIFGIVTGVLGTVFMVIFIIAQTT